MKWVLIDLSFLAHRALHSTGELETEDIPTGVLYGFFEQLYSICKCPVVSSNKILIFTDSRRSWRNRAYPEYKKKRREQRTEEEQQQLEIMYKQIDILKNKALPRMGVPVYRQIGLESDDLIAIAAKQLTKMKEEAIIITSDGDLYQCITPFVQWYDPQRNLLITEESFQDLKGIAPGLWGMVKAIAGCATDNVPGLKGIGEKGAIKYLRTELPVHLKQFKTISEGTEEIKKWAELVVLPHKKTKPIFIEEPEYNSKIFFSFCKHYDILSYLKDSRKLKWINFFKGEFKGTPRRAHAKRKLI